MKKPYFSRKESIVISAIEIIEELGVAKFSLRELAGRQGISEAAIYRHYVSKEAIILAILDHYSRFDISIMNTARNEKVTPKEAISFFASSLAELYEGHPALASVLNSYEVMSDESEIYERVKNILFARGQFLKDIVEKAKESKEIKVEINSEDISDIILGTIRLITLKWKMNKYNFPLKQRVGSAILSILELL